eukprot:TRINITY_DN25533_c0_g1_i1.p1 TRINITY_DN25533_c0_g1~~TRINITY_DN25533_c0_g1_i1.p1  ORF type:complete len:666 (-),score=124.29 TRINITY_DN25533_c0_g1_i1:65-2062(-)
MSVPSLRLRTPSLHHGLVFTASQRAEGLCWSRRLCLLLVGALSCRLLVPVAWVHTTRCSERSTSLVQCRAGAIAEPPTAPPTAHLDRIEGDPRLGASEIEELLELPQNSKDALREREILRPSPIQAVAFRRIIRGHNVILHSVTGSGKTLAFLLPALQVAREAGPGSVVLVLAPTRELAVQIMAEGEFHSHGEVALVTLGAQASWNTIMGASLIVATPSDLMEAFDEEDAAEVKQLLSSVRVLVLDEFDDLVPKKGFEGKVRYRYQDGKMWPAEGLIKRLLRNNENQTLQLVAASATAYKASRDKLAKLLRTDKMDRFKRKPRLVVPLMPAGGMTQREGRLAQIDREVAASRAAAADSSDEDDEDIDDEDEDEEEEDNEEDDEEGGAEPRPEDEAFALTVPIRRGRKGPLSALPAGIEHYTWRVPLRGSHTAELATVLDIFRPESALVFACPNAGESVLAIVEDLQAAGWLGAQSLTKELFPDSRASMAPRLRKFGKKSAEAKGMRSSQRLLGLRELTRQGWQGAGSYSFREAPILVSSEESVRGLDLDAVEAVFVLGLPKDATSYLHMAGRTGRLPHPYGRSILVAHGRELQKVTRGFEGQTLIRNWLELNPRDRPRLDHAGGIPGLPPRHDEADDMGGGGGKKRRRSAAADALDAALGPSLLR